MINVFSRRASHLELLVIPALVQGNDAAPQLIRALQWANEFNLGEVVVLARGGGSIEDLWCFNDERLARAIAASRLPVLSAVGHEIDFTISDFVADLRAPTPSAAAEILSGYWTDSARQVREASARLEHSIRRDFGTRRTLLEHVAARLVSPRDRLREQAQRCDELDLRMARAIELRLERVRTQLERLATELHALSPLRVLERGYTILKGAAPGGAVLRSAREVQPDQELQVIFHDGSKRVRAIS
jgi:exodeoxyribonuclease VII large subunit